MTLDINIVYRRWDSFVTQIHSIFHEDQIVLLDSLCHHGKKKLASCPMNLAC
ncbi:hypothetical protein I3842_14G129600 [Carya illinoinensis]|uniref:Uncharacterized protein n=1 Tax=Carya illinoinensis TaxID=32201 RepID=A0A922ADM5_CARIL|nr:hypothetical protein I3842_14G129600 [Carya illinoinensis]